MSFVKGIKGLQAAIDKPEKDDRPKTNYLSVKAGSSVRVRFLQELDPDCELYDPARGLGVISVEHVNPENWRRSAACTKEQEGHCYGCERHAENYKAGWGPRKRFYINVLAMPEGEEPYVAVLSQGISKKAVTPSLIEFYNDNGPITDFTFRIKRDGEGKETEYTLVPVLKKEDVDTSGLTLFDIEKDVVRTIPYEEQERFYDYVYTKDEDTPAPTRPASSASEEW